MHRFEVCGPERYHELMGSPDWWTKRGRLLEDYLLPNFRAQTCHDFDVLFTLRPEERELAEPVVEPARRYGAEIAVAEYEPFPYPMAPQYYPFICDRWAGADWLVVLHCAGDDLYATDTVERMRWQEPPTSGLILWWAQGYIFDISSTRLARIGSERGPQAFYAGIYSGEALADPEAFDAYRKRWRFNRFHHEMSRAPRSRRQPDGGFCQLLHSANVGSGWAAPDTDKKLNGNVPAAQRAGILHKFGIDFDLLRKLKAMGYA